MPPFSIHLHGNIHLEVDPLASEFREEMHVDKLRSNQPHSLYRFKADFFLFLWVFLCFLHFLQLGNSSITFVISKHKSHNKKLKAHIQNADPNHLPNTVMGTLGLGCGFLSCAVVSSWRLTLSANNWDLLIPPLSTGASSTKRAEKGDGVLRCLSPEE